jgi:hypothetical protein
MVAHVGLLSQKGLLLGAVFEWIPSCPGRFCFDNREYGAGSVPGSDREGKSQSVPPLPAKAFMALLLELGETGLLPLATLCLSPNLPPDLFPGSFLDYQRPRLKFSTTQHHQLLLSSTHPFALLCRGHWQWLQEWELIPHPCPAITASFVHLCCDRAS